MRKKAREMIEKVSIEDIDVVFTLYDLATAYQKTKFDKTWSGFERELIEREIKEGRLWKFVEDHDISCIFSIGFSDALIWGEKDLEPAIYLHRIAVNPIFRGHGYVKKIIEWARIYAVESGINYIRLDTFGDNQELIDYYVKCGFTFIGFTSPQNTSDLPAHYEGISLSLFEIEVS